MRPSPSAIRSLQSPFVVRSAIAAKGEIVAQMADDLRCLAAATGAIVADDLELLGWTEKQIADHGTAARRTAQALSAGNDRPTALPEQEMPRHDAAIVAHVADLALRAQGLDPALVRAQAARRQGGGRGTRERARIMLTRAEALAALLEPHLFAFREMVETAEAQGWDDPATADLAAMLDRGRDAHAALTGFDNTRPEKAAA